VKNKIYKMWTIIKIKKNYNFNSLKIGLKKLLVSSPKIYSPKILEQTIKGNKFYNKNCYILGNYLLVFHEKFKDKFYLNKLNFTKDKTKMSDKDSFVYSFLSSLRQKIDSPKKNKK